MKESTYKPLAPRFAARREGFRRGTGMLPVPECRALSALNSPLELAKAQKHDAYNYVKHCLSMSRKP